MANRRMISKNVINSAKFLKMPSETQALYFHLCMHSDDDGVCEAFTVMRLVGSSEDNIRVLQAKNFITVLNEDLVTYIMDWNEHNMLRADRKIDSIYKELLLRIIPDVELIEPKQRADRKKNIGIGYNGTSQGQPMDGLVEDRLVEYSLEDKIQEFISYRSSLGKKNTMTDRAITAFRNKISRSGLDEKIIIEAIDKSMINNWKDIYLPEKPKPKQPAQTPETDPDLLAIFTIPGTR